MKKFFYILVINSVIMVLTLSANSVNIESIKKFVSDIKKDIKQQQYNIYSYPYALDKIEEFNNLSKIVEKEWRGILDHLSDVAPDKQSQYIIFYSFQKGMKPETYIDFLDSAIVLFNDKHIDSTLMNELLFPAFHMKGIIPFNFTNKRVRDILEKYIDIVKKTENREETAKKRKLIKTILSGYMMLNINKSRFFIQKEDRKKIPFLDHSKGGDHLLPLAAMTFSYKNFYDYIERRNKKDKKISEWIKAVKFYQNIPPDKDKTFEEIDFYLNNYKTDPQLVKMEIPQRYKLIRDFNYSSRKLLQEYVSNTKKPLQYRLQAISILNMTSTNVKDISFAIELLQSDNEKIRYHVYECLPEEIKNKIKTKLPSKGILSLKTSREICKELKDIM